MHCAPRNQALDGPLGHLQAWEAVPPCGGRPAPLGAFHPVVPTPPPDARRQDPTWFLESPEVSAVVASNSAFPGFSDWCVEERLGRVHLRGWERGGWAPRLHHTKLLETSPLDHTER